MIRQNLNKALEESVIQLISVAGVAGIEYQFAIRTFLLDLLLIGQELVQHIGPSAVNWSTCYDLHQ